MTLPSSGPLSMSAINAEFGRGNNLNSYRGTVWYTDAGASGTFSSGAISFSEFYGKRVNSPSFSFTISSNQVNANLRTLAINAGWNQSSALIATIASGVQLYSSSTGTPALTVSGSFPGGVQLINNGYIVGRGGDGGRGGYSSGNPDPAYRGLPGNNGGTGLSVGSYITITNNGVIGGGGGGGGGGGLGSEYYGADAGGGGGGGGGGYGSGGIGGYWTTTGPAASQAAAGQAGGIVSGGTGANGAVSSLSRGGKGGNGGSSGAGGGTGAAGTYWNTNTRPGGGAGAAVSGNAYISWAATGTRYGAIT